ncbi:restriction endonuclease subunit S [Streptomyces anulatus]|uniref:restriction endonuclease subunit S n=1 Tax=Streptomyces anulatus TaxID=1892 RepID=UPI002E12BF7D|nr:restriction endonuclease subunit S [Streptomyces anulatus]WSI75721.1 restriction endonuclease subunit S [Streptomyces anulatus]
MTNEVPASWRIVRLSDVLSEPLVNGRSPRPGEGGLPVLRMPALRAVTVDFTQSKSSDRSGDGHAILLAEHGDVLVGRVNGSHSLVGEGALVDGPPAQTAIPDSMIRVRVRPDVLDSRYLAHLWKSPIMRRQIGARARQGGAAIWRINQRDLADVLLPLPPMAEQRRIVGLLEDHLARIDATTARTHNALDQADALSRALTARAGRGALAGTARVPADLPRAAGIEDGRLPGLPERWWWTRLHDVAEVSRGITPPGTQEWSASDTDVSCLRVANVQRGRLDLDDVRTIRLPPSQAEAARLRAGDVLLTGGGSIDSLGRGWIWEEQLLHCVPHSHLFRVRITAHQLHPVLLAWHANGFGRTWCHRNATHSVGPASISLARLRLMPVPVAPVDEQHYLVAVLQAHTASLNGACAVAERALELAGRLRRNLLERAFTGHLSPPLSPSGQQESVL